MLVWSEKASLPSHLELLAVLDTVQLGDTEPRWHPALTVLALACSVL